MISGDVFKRGIFGLALLLCALAQIALAAEWQSDWDNTLAAAKKENVVTVITDVTASMRDALTMSFQSKYGLQETCSEPWAGKFLPGCSPNEKPDDISGMFSFTARPRGSNQ